MRNDPNNNFKKNFNFFNAWASHYDFCPFQWWMKKFQEPILQELDHHSNIKILDLSCGTGELLLSLSRQKKNHQLYGVDLSPAMIAVARKKLPPEVLVQEADVHALPFSSHTFDYVVSTEAFHHYYDQQKALQEMKRVAKKGGKVVVADINFFFWFIHWLFQKLEPGCVSINNKSEMRLLFQEAGLNTISQQRHFIFSITTQGTKS